MKQITWLFMAITLCLVLPALAVEQGINLSGTWILDRDKSDINSASGLMGREDFTLRAPQDAVISG